MFIILNLICSGIQPLDEVHAAIGDLHGSENIPENLEINLLRLLRVHIDWKISEATSGYLNLACRLYMRCVQDFWGTGLQNGGWAEQTTVERKYSV